MKFADKVLKVRLQLNISQESLAKELGIAFVTLNRWENGHTEPKVLTRHRFDEFCKKHGIAFEDESKIHKE